MRRRSPSHLRLVAPPRWQPLCSIRLGYQSALADAFCALPEVDECAAVRRFLEHDPPDRVYAAMLGDPIARRIVAFTFGTAAATPQRFTVLRGYVQLLRDARYLIGLGHTLDAEGVPMHWTRRLLRKLQATWFAQDAKLRGDTRPLDVIAREIEDDEIPSSKTTPKGEETTQRVRTPFGAVFTCVALDSHDGTMREEYRWDFPDDIDPSAWRTVVDQATVRHMQLWSRYRRMNDAYFTHRGGIVRTMAIHHRGAEVERCALRAMPNYEPMVVTGSAVAH